MFYYSPEGAKVCSPARKRWEKAKIIQAPKGRKPVALRVSAGFEVRKGWKKK